MGKHETSRYQQWLDAITVIAMRAGDIIMEVYLSADDMQVEMKADNSPLTRADRAANDFIVRELLALDAGVPVLSEELALQDYSIRGQWTRYWLVDPLDGTKEFISRNGEFTVNIALIENGEPVLGAVCAPVLGKCYVGGAGLGAWLLPSGGERVPLKAKPVSSALLRVVGSRRHGAEKMEAILNACASRFTEVQMHNVGSSLKFCQLAEGKADLYPRPTPVSEWDAGAAHAVLRAAGGEVYSPAFEPLRYNVGNEVIVPAFVAVADVSFTWNDMLKGLL